MYPRSRQVRAWVDETPSSHQNQQRQDRPGPSKAPSVLWAKRAWNSRLGRCVAIRLRRNEVEVAVAGPERVRWVRAELVLSDADAARWAAQGF